MQIPVVWILVVTVFLFDFFFLGVTWTHQSLQVSVYLGFLCRSSEWLPISPWELYVSQRLFVCLPTVHYRCIVRIYYPLKQVFQCAWAGIIGKKEQFEPGIVFLAPFQYLFPAGTTVVIGIENDEVDTSVILCSLHGVQVSLLPVHRHQI